ncbi:GhoT/OrtT family toxin (plasmid) [Pantoea sp. C3]|uniref:GhoT/OrtT family toxin n=1 Tax=Pantoea phytostimulans TaxID=2769024 RepID=UPI0038F78497
MTLYQHMLIFYAVVASVAALITFFIAKDKFSIKLLSAFLVGATWPMSFPVALMFALF